MASTGKGKPAGGGISISPAIFAGAVVVLVLIVVVIAYFSFRGPSAAPTAAVQAQNKAMSADPTLMGKAGEGK